MGDDRFADVWELGSAYERYVGRWSRRLAPPFLAWLGIASERSWLDVGCGTGALCAAIVDHASPSAVIGVEPSDGFLTTARAELGDRVELVRGSAAALPLADAAVDVVVSGLVLNFVPSPREALVEMARVTCPGGTIAAHVWDYAGGAQFLRSFWDAAVELDPAADELDEGVRFPLCRPGALERSFEEAGLTKVAVAPIDIATPFADFAEYWRPFLGGQGPAPAYVATLDEAARDRLRDRLRARLPTGPDGSIALTARAWAVRGTVPA